MSHTWLAVVPAISIFAALCPQGQKSSTLPVRSEVETQPFVFRVTTREVLVEVLATDLRGHPIRNLQQDELQVFEVHGRSKTPVASISKFQPVDPAQAQKTQAAAFGVTVGGGCAARAAFHYEIAYHPGPEGWRSGYHEIEVRSTRHGIRLAYRDHYYAPETAPLVNPPSANDADEQLWRAACYHSDFPPTLVLRASQVGTPDADVYRYFVTVDVDSLDYLTMEGQSRRVQLDYGVCTFDQAGRGLYYMHAGIDRLLSSSEYAQSEVNGFPNLLEFPRIRGAAMERIALRDRATGNTGLVDIPLASSPSATPGPSLPPATLTADEQGAAEAGTVTSSTGRGLSISFFRLSGPSALSGPCSRAPVHSAGTSTKFRKVHSVFPPSGILIRSAASIQRSSTFPTSNSGTRVAYLGLRAALIGSPSITTA